MRLILASASARRRELLAAAGVPFHQDAADTDERRMPGELPEAYVARVALAKAQAGHISHSHDVLTGVALVWAGDHRVIVERTRVWFAQLSEADIDWYVRSGEPRDKAGA